MLTTELIKNKTREATTGSRSQMTGSAFSEREGDGSFLGHAYYRTNKELRREGQRARRAEGLIARRITGSAFSEREGEGNLLGHAC